jgi:hypothetical protein
MMLFGPYGSRKLAERFSFGTLCWSTSVHDSAATIGLLSSYP